MSMRKNGKIDMHLEIHRRIVYAVEEKVNNCIDKFKNCVIKLFFNYILITYMILRP
jgi:hypothetical protein